MKSLEFQAPAWIIIRFAYQVEIVNAVRALPGRVFDKSRQCWIVPAVHASAVMAVLGPLGFDIPAWLRNCAARQNTEQEQLRQAKSAGIGYLKISKKFPLFPYQKIGASFLYLASSSLLADEPGLGKTLQAISALNSRKPILILCPASLKYNWQAEIQKWTSHSAVVIDGSKEDRRRAWGSAGHFFIANYELLLHDFDFIKKEKYFACVCDEATRIANPFTKTYKRLNELRFSKKIALTGTPISNSPLDLYGIINWLSPGFLGNYKQFLRLYTVTDRYGAVRGYRDLSSLAARIEPLMLRRTKTEVLPDLPAKTFQTVSFSLTGQEMNLYNAIRQEIAEELQKLTFDRRFLNILPVKMLRLKQTTGHPCLIDPAWQGSASKLDALKEILEPILKSGEKAVIFTQFASMLKILVREIINWPDCKHLFSIHGEVKQFDRQKAVDAFNAASGSAVMLMTEAGAYGLNLQTAPYVVHYDSPWSIAKLTQREDRVHRYGQTKNVTVYNLVARNTIDEYIVKVLHAKQKTSVTLLQDEERLEKMGLEIDDIRAILRLA